MLSMDEKLSSWEFMKLWEWLMQDGPKIEYRSPDKWRGY
jgi:hypothetical protein